MALFAQNNFKWPPLRFGHIQRNYDLLFRDNGASADAPRYLIFTGEDVRGNSSRFQCYDPFCEKEVLKRPQAFQNLKY